MTRVDLPEPETPVTQVNRPTGKSAVRSWRLCSRAPMTRICSSDGDRRCAGMGIELLARQVLAGERLAVLEQLLVRAGVDDLAAVLAGAGADVDDVVGLGDGLLVVLDDDDGVAQLAEAQEGVDEAAVVALVEADGRLVEHVEHADQAGADLGGEPDALGLSPGQGAGVAGQGEVVEADIEEEAHAGVDLLDHGLGDELVALGQLEAGQGLGRLADGQVADVGDVVAVDQHGERDGVEALALAGGAGHLAHVALDLLPLTVGIGLAVATGEVRDGALVVGVVGAGPAVAVLVGDRDLGDALAVEQGIGLLLGQLGPGRARVDVEVLGHRLDQAGEVLGAAARPGSDGAVLQRQVGIGDDELGVDLVAGAEPVAGRAGAVRRVEREVARRQVLEAHPAGGAGEVLAEGERVLRGGLTVAGDDHDLGHAVGQGEGGLQ